MNQSASTQQSVRKNNQLASLHSKTASLLQRISASRGNPSLRDCAMAGIYATQLEKRKYR